MAYEDFCAACTYLGERGDTYGKYYCSKKGDRYATDPRCGSFCEAYSRSNYARENMLDYSKEHTSGGCYLTTAMCNILGYPDDNYYLQTLRTFRDKTMKYNIKYIPLLITYDTVGPLISSMLLQDSARTDIAKTLFSRYIEPSVLAIENNKIETAINTYIAMTDTLAKRYNINTNIIIPDIKDIDYSLLGHARIKVK